MVVLDNSPLVLVQTAIPMIPVVIPLEVVVAAGQGFSKASSMAYLGWHTTVTSRPTHDNIHRAQV